MKITLVKKVLADGSPCKKCGEVIEKLEKSGQMAAIDRIIVADEADDQSEGMVLAKQLGVTRAPFFVTDDNGQQEAHTIYIKFAKEVLEPRLNAQ